ncbi:MAG: hypothetical protein LUQ40_06820 [Methanomicrobiales archaeon]|nr:hypothetical protein [Methanomicrobiales archaeon]
MPSCRDCINFSPKTEQTGECATNGTTEPGRETERCPSRTFIPRPPPSAKQQKRR